MVEIKYSIGRLSLWWHQRQNQLIQAIKTLLIVIVTWLLLSKVDAYAQLIGAIVGSFLSLLRFGRSYQEQFFTVLYSAIAMAVVATLALTLYSIPWLSGTVFVVLVFIAFFLRRFGGRFFLPPLFVILLYLVIEMMPKPPLLALWLAFAVAAVVALVLIFFIFPIDDRKQIQSNMKILFDVSGKISNSFLMSVKDKSENRLFFELQRNYTKVVLSLHSDNLRVLNEFLLLERDDQLENFCNYHYRLAKTFAMLFESCGQLLKSHQVSDETFSYIAKVMECFITVLRSSKVQQMNLCITSLSVLKQQYEQFRQYPFEIDLTLPDSVHIFNFSLGMERVIETLALWEKECE
ncbi:hypothetical protein [Piscirickettsia salmonis]|uniref:hypothetical protein n=1 Tax=Piscirickettsia salmonis TaxID=1238 RepID=UPI0007C915B5|nr:hypothetical protein A0O36_01445 [Piscirickettsiaceae bacterium NZ-RLO1]